MRENIRGSSNPKALAAWFHMPLLANAMDEVRLSIWGTPLSSSMRSGKVSMMNARWSFTDEFKGEAVLC